MSKFLIGVLTGAILLGLLLVIVFFAAVRGRESPPKIADGSTLVLELEGEISERTPVEFPIPFFQQRTRLTVENVWSLLRKAAADSRIKAVVLEPSDLQVGWGKLQEIHGNLEQFKKTGKPLFAYLKSPGTREYYLATAANQVYIAPEDMLDLKGLRAELLFFRKTLDKLGVEVEIQHAGKYKDFGDMFTRTSMSPETKEVLDSVLDEIYKHLLSTIATGRKKTVEEIRATIDEGPFLSQQALSKGLVDSLRYEDEMYGELKKRLNVGEIKKLSHRTYLRVPQGSLGLEGKDRIALLTGEGGITRGDPEDDSFSSDSGIQSEGFNKLLRRVGNDSGIKGVVVRIDSPGGEVFASDAIWRDMNLLSKKKPLVISMSDVAASGGYYIAMTGDPVIAYPGTFTGSIGVVYGKPNLHGLYEKLGITKDFLTRGRYADIDSDYKPLGQGERQKLREAIDANYKSFVSKVAEARKRKFEELEPLAQGRVWLGSQAKARGLVDELGGLDRAIEIVKKKANLAAADKITLVTYPPRRSIFDVMFSRSSENAVESRLRTLLHGWEAKLWLKGGLLRIMPYAIEVR